MNVHELFKLEETKIQELFAMIEDNLCYNKSLKKQYDDKMYDILTISSKIKNILTTNYISIKKIETLFNESLKKCSEKYHHGDRLFIDCIKISMLNKDDKE